ncbi:MAG: type I DNA topoisomerase [Acidimicrobiia bacterium]|nr:type I DNA topoisomerase [Acidimicrobiia bacterium]
MSRRSPDTFDLMGARLVIVESPAKARTIAGYLGSDYLVESSRGHIRDLPANAREVPEAYKGESWANLGVDVDNDFKPLYVVSADRKQQVTSLKKLVKDADELYLATDEDREGEAIAWHLLEVLSPPATVPVKRMVFHEITPQAIRAAIDNPREIDRRLVDAQEARRILDRLYGYEISPVLWRKVLPKLSAGRVQSVATRMVVEREWERMRFVTASYWDLDGLFATAREEDLGARMVALDGSRLATGKDFTPQGELSRAGAVVLDESTATTLAAELRGRPFEVSGVESKPYRRSPAAPFITSTLQQEAARKLRLSSSQAMRAAQSLYEGGFITYMRTDSTTLSDTALAAARRVVRERYGEEFLPKGPRQYTKKVKNSQEAHEAIRPAGEVFRAPAEIANQVNGTEARLYELVWQRTVASQMTDATGETVTVRIEGATEAGRRAEFSTSGTVITHAGFQRVYVEDVDEGEDGSEDERRLPPLRQGDRLDARELEAKGHTTQPPARYTEASLIKRLEELGVGRPSTYTSILSTIQDRGYVWKKGSALVPSFTAFAVVRVLEGHFPDLVDYAFTARMEDDLDHIAAGGEEAVPWLSRFYFGGEERVEQSRGNGHGISAAGLKQLVSNRLDEIDPREVNAIRIGEGPDGVPIAVRVGRYGPYLQRGEDRAGLPDDLVPDELTVERALGLLDAPGDDEPLGTDPASGLEVYLRRGRFGPYVQLGEDDDSGTKPKRGSLFSDMDPASLSLEQALQLLSLPRVLGELDGEEVVAQNGRFGPFIKKGGDTRSLGSEAELLTITLDGAAALLAEPKRRRGQAPKPPLRELGADPVSGKPMVVKEGRFGPYVTDGESNASLRRGDSVEELTDERAAELLAERREREASGIKPKRGRGAAKKPAAKAKKPATKKPAAKKPAAKKPAAKAAPVAAERSDG